MNQDPHVLEQIEGLAWVHYLDSKTSRAFDCWLGLWLERSVSVPEGAWETP